MECSTCTVCYMLGQYSSVICYTVDGMLHIQAMFVCYMIHSWWNVAAMFCYMLHSWWNVAHTRQCSSVICYTVDGMLHIQAMFVCYMLHSWWNVAHTGNARLLYATQLMGMLHINGMLQAMFVCYMLHSWWNVAHTANGNVECCTCRQCYMLHSWWNVAHTANVRLLYATQAMAIRLLYATQLTGNVDGMLHIQAMFVCHMF